MERLRARFPKLELPPTEDICYATTNRQAAVAELSDEAGLVLVVGSKTSSNSNRLVETARAKGRAAYLVQSPEEIEPAWLDGVEKVALSSGASAPEYLVQQTIARLRELGARHVEERIIIAEDVAFPLPKVLLNVIQAGQAAPAASTGSGVSS
jgi:4-hydroxy-3-methylbut-2-enyl diphosphate reductase